MPKTGQGSRRGEICTPCSPHKMPLALSQCTVLKTVGQMRSKVVCKECQAKPQKLERTNTLSCWGFILLVVLKLDCMRGLCILTLPFTQGHFNEVTHIMSV